ncbi:tetratricopeptide repeat protein [Pedobacter deserti]|uniref:tetratricopeptide repeat protein n=1 Tax=Pedobacter deserti TaxID=2817382 RepID=UPI00210DC4FE|nr:tetratricopeptide repeat protein [Pedobacter sp. SYSU D00382]
MNFSTFKCLILLISIAPLFLSAQQKAATDLVFNKNFYDMENQWVVFPKKHTDSAYAYGVVYVDSSAGFTFDFQGTFKVMDDGTFSPKPFSNSGNAKVRLETNIAQVSPLSADRLKQLNLPQEAAFLKHYKVNMEETRNIVTWGRHYNHVGAYAKALEYLLNAYAKEPHAAGLEFELAFNYNATKKFDKAAEVLNVAMRHDPKNFWFYRELGYTYMNLGKLEDAEKTYSAGIDLAGQSPQKMEMAYNMAYGFFSVRNKGKFEEWYKKAEQLIANPNSVMMRNLNDMKQKL